jgi:hypothetical protein
MPEGASRGLTLAAGILGILLIASGLAWMTGGITVPATAWTVVGVILFWWGVSEYRKTHRGTPESELDGDHTVE